MPGRWLLGSFLSALALVCAASVDVDAGGKLKEDANKIKGTWTSGPVKDADGRGSGTFKLTLVPHPGTLTGQGVLEVVSTRPGSTSKSTRRFNFQVLANGPGRKIEAEGSAETGLSLSYRLKGEQLLVSGRVVSRGVAYNLKNAALNRQ